MSRGVFSLFRLHGRAALCVLVAIAMGALALWAFAPLTASDRVEPAAAEEFTGTSPAAVQDAFDPSVFDVVLRPAPPPPPPPAPVAKPEPPPPPPRLRLTLVAIFRGPDGAPERAAIYDPDRDALTIASVGQRLAGGETVERVEAGAAHLLRAEGTTVVLRLEGAGP